MRSAIPSEAIERGLLSLTWQHALMALGTFIGFFLLAKLAGGLTRRLLSKRSHVGRARFALSKLLSYFLVFVGVVAALGVLGLPFSSLVVALSALLIGIGFSLQHTARDMVAGMVLLAEQRIREGDFVTFGDTSGQVREIGLRSTCVLTRDGITLVVPNHLLVTDKLSNQSHPVERAQIHIMVPVALSANIDAVEEALFEVARAHSEVLANPPPGVKLTQILDTHLELTLSAWVKEPRDTLRIASELRFAVAREFARRRLPFPTPELRLRGLERSSTTASPHAASDDISVLEE
jgi:small-conductance mechanosensitive channel